MKSLAMGHTLFSSLPHPDHLWGTKHLTSGLFTEWKCDQITMVSICLKCVVSRIFVWPVNWPLLITHIVYIIHSLSTLVENCLDCHIRRELFRTPTQNGAHLATFQVITLIISGVPRNFFQGGSTNSVEDRGEREWGSGGSSPLVRGSGGSCNLVKEISFHMVKFS